MPIGTVEQAKQARQELASKNTKVVYQLPDELRLAGEPIHIFNVSRDKWTICMGGMGTWTIQACEKGQKYSEPLEIPFIMNEGIPVDMDHIEFRSMAGRSFALSIIGIGQHRHPSEDLRKQGIFVAKGAVPTEEELAEANANLRARHLDMVEQADGFYGDGPGEYKNITKRHRESLDWLIAEGIDEEDRPWHKPLKAMNECPICFQKVHPSAIIHSGPGACGQVINEEEVIRRKLRGYEYLWEKRTVTREVEDDSDAPSEGKKGKK